MNTIRIDPLQPGETVLVLVDFVYPLDFDGAEAFAPSAWAAAQRSAALRERLSARGCRTVYANDNYGRWTSEFKVLWRRCARREGPAGRIARALKPTPRDFAVLEPRHSAFYARLLDLLLKQLRYRRLVVTGIAASNCVLFTAMGAYLRDDSL